MARSNIDANYKVWLIICGEMCMICYVCLCVAMVVVVGGRMVGVCDAGMHDCAHICLYFHVHLVDVICV